MLATGAVALLALASCGGGAASGSSGEKRPFSELERAARGDTVDFFMYGGDTDTNEYVDEWVAPRLEREHGITLRRTPVSDTADVVNKLLNEKQAGKDEGTVDLVWINGENFYTGSRADLWFGPWAERLPNAEHIAWDDPEVNRDFGYPVDGHEAPWSQSQFVMIYDSRDVPDPPKTADELRAHIEENPGSFAYPAPPDFTGSAFVEQLFYETTGGPEPYQRTFDREVFEQGSSKLYGYLNELEPNLYREGETYPKSVAEVDDLFANGQVDFTMSYNPYHARQQVERGIFPEGTRSYLFEGGTLSNTSYVAIPFNSPDKAAAQVTANFLQGTAAQLELQRRSVVGGLTALDLSTLPEGERGDFAEAQGDAASAPDLAELQESRVPEARSEWLLELQDGWVSDVQRD
jgi:putative spermidine/putrescine transport system substrate-binding protein